MCVTPQHFAEHLEVLQRETAPVSLKKLVQAYKEGNIPARAVAVTFDDGYADNLYGAKPLLERYNIPATVFVANGYIGHEREFWWDELERILLQPGPLPERLTLTINGKTHQWELGDTGDDGKHQNHRDCGVIDDGPANRIQRGSLYFSVHRLLQPLSDAQRNKVIDDLLVWAGTKPVRRPTHRTLSFEELHALKQGELIEIGSHTVTHPFLSVLPESVQQNEVWRSKSLLEESIGQPVRSFAYPYGNYTKETVAIVREAGFDCACSTIVDSVWRGSDLFQLPRMTVENWNGEEFAKRLSRIS
jgi:peptidoglycan/xylan/chitin deacetylase (PgdA/CDA1 family)